MTASTKFRGHSIEYNEDIQHWVYEDTKEPAGFDFDIRPCKKCGKLFEGSNKGQADRCLGELPGVDNACCGHGDPSAAYVRFTNGVVLKGFTVETS